MKLDRTAIFAFGVALVGALSLSACQSPNSTATIQNVNTALAVGCPVVASIQASSLKLTNAQSAALKTLALACPPNAPPIAAGTLLSDLVQAYVILSPLVPALVKP